MTMHATAADGTRIAYETTGTGPPLILVDGALCYRASGPSRPLAEALADRFTVLTYDRRGRGESGGTAPFTIEQEVADLAALIEAAGGEALLYGISSGAALALEAADRGLPITKLAVYEAPFIVDGTREPVPGNYAAEMDRLLAAGKRGDAVRWFMRRGVGLPGFVVGMMRLMPAWPKLKGVAHTLPADVALTVDHQQGTPLPAGRWQGVTIPTLVVAGGKSDEWMRNGMRALADVLPKAEHRTLDGQTHLVKPAALAPVLTGFLSG
jgi:pimeloyl-ACP methyl ester carboxylesterase